MSWSCKHDLDRVDANKKVKSKAEKLLSRLGITHTHTHTYTVPSALSDHQ